MLALFLLTFGVLILSGCLACSEAAILSLTGAEIEEMVQQKRIGSIHLERLVRKKSWAITAIVICNNVVNIIGSILVGQIIITKFGDAFLAMASTALAFAIIIFADIIPKTIGIHNAHIVGPLVAPAIRLLVIILFPIIIIIQAITRFFQRGDRKIGTESQIRSLVRQGMSKGFIEPGEEILINRIFLLNDITAREIMIPRELILAIPIDTTVEQAYLLAISKPHDRFPVFDKNIDHVMGMVLKSDISEAMARDEHNRRLREFIRPIEKISPTLKLNKLLVRFRKDHTRLALIIERNKTVGLITLEEILKTLIGEMKDERMNQ